MLRREDSDGHIGLTCQYEVNQTGCTTGTLGKVSIEEEQAARGGWLGGRLSYGLGAGCVE